MWKRRNIGNEWEGLLEGFAWIKMAKQEHQRIMEQRERACEDEDEDYCPMDDALEDEKAEKTAAEDGEPNDYDQFASFGDEEHTPQLDARASNDNNDDDNVEGRQEAESEEDKLLEDLAYEVIGEMLAGGAVDRALFFEGGDEGGNNGGGIQRAIL
ncbi:unknown protein [Seminavis robusta]|uniref:Uncharacterized protein n=1 Tax=Seminavis robusta TaxID=568900 RepID=A0A9N8HST9_9STRA|nr:unknown protein [Seminavis robusta]|eukprot:Sro1564_g282780.1 n/a (156) ;mRNA; r:19967-20434